MRPQSNKWTASSGHNHHVRPEIITKLTHRDKRWSRLIHNCPNEPTVSPLYGDFGPLVLISRSFHTMSQTSKRSASLS